MQGRQLTKNDQGKHHEDINQLMNQLRHVRDKNAKLNEQLAKKESSVIEMINVNANLKINIRNMKTKQALGGGRGGSIDVDDAPMDFDANMSKSPTSSPIKNKQKLNITEFENQIEQMKKIKDQLVQKHLNYKIKSDRMIDKLSKEVSTSTSKICELKKQT